MMMIVMIMMMMMVACSWVRDARLFNNKYYKLMAGVPDRVFESCTGTLDDKV